MTAFHKDVLIGGLLKDFGDALARELALTPRYVTLPRKRVEAALQAGSADLLCDLRPEWLDTKGWLWTEAVFINNMIIAGRRETPALDRLAGIAGERVGTVLGYHYPELDTVLGNTFTRDDAGTDDANTNKLLNRRFRYMVSNSLYYDYQRKTHPNADALNPVVFNVRPFETYCALPLGGRLAISEVNRAILTLRETGEMQRIYARYRPLR